EEEITLGDISEFGGLDEGEFTLYLQDTDAAGNVGIDSVLLTKDTIAPTVVSYTPSNNAVGIDPTSDIIVTFDEAMNILPENITLQREGDTPVSVAVTLDGTAKIATINPDSDLADNSTYTIALSGATDEAGNPMAYESWTFTTAASYAIELKTGWNLVSLPVTPTTWSSTTAVLASINGNVERVWSYNAVNGTWSIYNANGAPSNLNIMTAGHGYWVKMTGDDTLEGAGTLYEQLIPSGDVPPSQLPEIPLAEGWNLIGYYQLPGKVNSPIENALSKLNGYWSGDGSDLITFTKGTLQAITPIYEMQPGAGYWIFMSSARKYSFGNGAF
ncbi:MAG: Ig-like domain-containing protein, partial [Planctomycetota bacterium]